MLGEEKSIFVAWVTIFWVFRLESLLQKWAYENSLATSEMRVFVVVFYCWMPSTIRISLFDQKIKKKQTNKQIKKKKKETAAERFSIESHKTETSNQCGLSEKKEYTSKSRWEPELKNNQTA